MWYDGVRYPVGPMYYVPSTMCRVVTGGMAGSLWYLGIYTRPWRPWGVQPGIMSSTKYGATAGGEVASRTR